jgi:hypothetical protein
VKLGGSTKRVLKIAGALLTPAALLGVELSFRFPDVTERYYSRGIYPGVVRLFETMNVGRFSWAEVVFVAASAVALAFLVLSWRRKGFAAAAAALWWLSGVVLWSFLVLWGFNYGRPPLEERLGLAVEDASTEALLATAKRVVEKTASLFEALGVEKGPTELPVSFAELDAIVDESYRELDLPGDAIDSRTTPAKPLLSSTLFSYLGISGIFVPFTGEPSVNSLQPDVALPIVLAHEKAHQRGITHEGEASFAAFLACSRREAPLYLRYSAYLFAARHLLFEASRFLPPEEIRPVWDLLGEGPLADVRAVDEFWRRYEGAVSDAASHVNDGYLRAMRVPEGVESYGTVARMILALDARGDLIDR